MHVSIVYDNNGVGLTRDALILSETLQADGIRTSLIPIREFNPDLPWTRLRQWRHIRALMRQHRRQTEQPPFDLMLFLEHIEPDYCRLARAVAYLPNPEWSNARDVAGLGLVNRVLAKTLNTRAIFEALGRPVSHIGFTSLDRWMPLPDSERRREFFHLAGRSRQKGTAALIEVWQRHPEWPTLTIIQHPSRARHMPGTSGIANIDHISRFLDDHTLRWMQNLYRFHLCPSEAEGYGHYIAEALSCGAIILSTDAAPMNELVTPDRGLLVAACRQTGQHLGMNHFVCADDLEAAIERLLALPEERLNALSQNARAWFARNDADFRQRLPAAVRGVVAGRPG